MAGPFFFHWADEGALPFDDVAHVSEDEKVLSFSIEHNEGDFPSLEITIENPRVGLLAPGRKIWAWLSYDRNGAIVPLFYGRLVGVPEDLHQEAVQLSFVARPNDYAAQKAAVADTLKVRPYWDPIWFSPENRDDPDNVLESRPELWHIDRVTHEVSTSNILVGEDGTLGVGENDVFYDSMRIGYGSAPLRSVQVTASVSWDQEGSGSVDLRARIGQIIPTFTGKSLAANWPKSGASPGGGWTLKESHAEIIGTPPPQVFGYFDYLRRMMTGGYHDVTLQAAFSFLVSGGGTGLSYSVPPHVLRVPMTLVRPTMVLKYDVSRKRSEGIAFILEADVQSILTDPGEDDALALEFSSSELTSFIDDPIDSSGFPRMPLRDRASPRYFSTDRGNQSIEYLLALARSRLLSRARTVTIDFEIAFDAAIDLGLTLRKSMFLTDYRLPGGEAGGKITAYSLSCDGDSGELKCSVSMGCSIGRGGSFEAVPGDPLYVEAGYVEAGYQQVENEFLAPFAGEVLYGSINGLPVSDDGINLKSISPFTAVLDYSVTPSAATQAAAMGTTAKDTGQVFDRLDKQATKVHIQLRPLTGGPFQTRYGLITEPLSVPKTIDLESEAVS